MNQNKQILQIQHYINALDLNHIFPKETWHAMSIKTFKSNELMIHASDKIAFLYVLVQGKAKVAPASIDGKEGFLDFIMPADIIGDLEYFAHDSSYYYNVSALSDCIIIGIPIDLIETTFEHNGIFYRYVCENLAQKMKRTSLKYAKTLLYPIKNQVAHYFLELYFDSGHTILPIKYKETSAFFDVSPRYLRQVITELENENILLRTNHGIKLIDIEKLKYYKIEY